MPLMVASLSFYSVVLKRAANYFFAECSRNSGSPICGGYKVFKSDFGRKSVSSHKLNSIRTKIEISILLDLLGLRDAHKEKCSVSFRSPSAFTGCAPSSHQRAENVRGSASEHMLQKISGKTQKPRSAGGKMWFQQPITRKQELARPPSLALASLRPNAGNNYIVLPKSRGGSSWRGVQLRLERQAPYTCGKQPRDPSRISVQNCHVGCRQRYSEHLALCA